jgi:hypothetical protein
MNTRRLMANARSISAADRSSWIVMAGIKKFRCEPASFATIEEARRDCKGS